MRALRLLIACGAAVLVGACETTDGFLGELGAGVMGEVRSVTGTASAPVVLAASDRLCGDLRTAVCHTFTATMLAGFSDEFINRLTQDDIRQAAAAREASLRTGEPQEWRNPDSGASGRVETEPAEPLEPRPTMVKVQRDAVQQFPMMDAVGERYLVQPGGGARVRSGPGLGFGTVEVLPGGSEVTAIARVRDENWFLVGRGSVGKGYVSGNLIMPAPTVIPEAPVQEEEPAGVQEVEVSMAAECFRTRQRVELADGTSEEAMITTCRTPNGWAQV
jgi:surface antigen